MGILKPFRLLQKQEIEAQASELLGRMESTLSSATQWPLETTQVAEFLGLDVVWDSIRDDEIGQIAGRLLPLKRLIEVNEDIRELRGFLGEVTIAHEIGHWVLHVNHLAVQRFLRLQARGVYIKNVEPLLRRSDNIIHEIEWQADYFASCLLMPEYILLEKRQKLDLTDPEHLDLMAQQLGVRSGDLADRLQNLGGIKPSLT